MKIARSMGMQSYVGGRPFRRQLTDFVVTLSHNYKTLSSCFYQTNLAGT